VGKEKGRRREGNKQMEDREGTIKCGGNNFS